VGALALAAALRLWGIRWGLPDATHLFSYHPDEYHSLRGALSLALGDPNPHFFNYGSLYLYMVAVACLWHCAVLGGPDLTAALMHGGPAHEAMAAWTLDARLVSALCGVATVAVVWAIGRRLGGGGLAAAAALTMAVLPLHGLNSHYGTVDAALTLFIALCLLNALRLQSERSLRVYALAGAAAGLAASVKYNGAVALLAPVMVHFLPAQASASPSGRRPCTLAALSVLAAAAAGAFTLTSPYVLLSWPEAWRDISFELQHMRVGETPVMQAFPNGWLFHLHPSLVLAVLALGLTRRGERSALALLLLFGGVWFAMIGASGVRYARYELPMEPLSAIFAAVAARVLWHANPRWLGRGGAVVLTGWVASLLVTSVCRDTALSRMDVRAQAMQAIAQDVPPEARVGLLWEPWFSVPPVDYCNGGAPLRASRLFARYRAPVRPLVITGVDAAELRRQAPDAVVVSDLDLSPEYSRVAPAYRDYAAALDDGSQYLPAVTFAGSFPGDHPVLGWTATDSRYASPCVRLYLRRPRQQPARPPGASATER
jgi:hypothetical protein